MSKDKHLKLNNCIKITSLQNPFVSHLVKLRLHSKYREEKQRALLCGEKVIVDLLAYLSPLSLIVTENILAQLPPLPIPLYVVSPQILEKISGVEGITMAAECPLPPPSSLKGKKFILALDNLQDPGNVGTLLRTALSLGWEGVFFLGNGCDLFNDKTLRSARGASFIIPYYKGTYEELLALKLKIYIAHTQGKEIQTLEAIPEGILLLSNESKGVQERLRTLGQEVTIPMTDTMESLNVAIAGAILMYHLRNL